MEPKEVEYSEYEKQFHHKHRHKSILELHGEGSLFRYCGCGEVWSYIGGCICPKPAKWDKPCNESVSLLLNHIWNLENLRGKNVPTK